MKNFQFNKDKILSLLEIGLVGIILVEGSRLLTGKVDKKEAFDKKPNTRHEQMIDYLTEENLQRVEEVASLSKPNITEDGYIDFGDGEIFNPSEKKNSANFDDFLVENISEYPTTLEESGIIYTAPEGYHLVQRAGNMYAVRVFESIDVTDPIVESNDGVITYSAPVSYSLIGNKCVKKFVKVDVTKPNIEFIGKLVKTR